MAQKINPTQLQAILDVAAARPEGASAPGILDALDSPMPMRTLQYRLRHLVTNGKLVREGNASASTYRVPRRSDRVSKMEGCADPEAVQLSEAGAAIRNYVSQPLAARKPVAYDTDFLESYRPNETRYLRDKDLARLHEAGTSAFVLPPAGTFAKRMLDRSLVELSWNSSRLEGNSFSILEAKRLIHFHFADDGKNLGEIQMILNHKEAISFLASSSQEIGFNRYTILNLHSILAYNLLDDPTSPGRVRHQAVGIGGSVYYPLENRKSIQKCFRLILEKAEAIRDPFEQSFFAMVHFPYLQAFDDVNKRVSRLAANIPLLKSNLSPLTFADVPKGLYVEALLGVYECNRHDLLKDLFLWAYGRSAAKCATVRQVTGAPDPLRFRYHSELRELVGSVLRESMDRTRAFEFVANWAKSNVSSEDVEDFREMAETELLSLHEGNFARYAVGLSEFRTWSGAWHSKLPGYA